MLQWPILLKSPGLFGKIGTCRTKKEDYSIAGLNEALKWCADARPGRKSGVIAKVGL